MVMKMSENKLKLLGYLFFGTIIVGVLIWTSYIILVVPNVKISVMDDRIQVKGKKFDEDIFYQQITNIYLDDLESIGDAKRIIGFQTAKAKMGTYKNITYGSFHLCVIMEVDLAIHIVANEEYYIFNCKNQDLLMKYYNEIRLKIE